MVESQQLGVWDGPPREFLTQEVGDDIIANCRKGAALPLAVKASGVRMDTLSLWLGAARRDPAGSYAQFIRVCDRAIHESQLTVVDAVRKKAVASDLKAMVFYLERMYPEQWGRRTLKVTARRGQDMIRSTELDLELLTSTQIENLRDLMRQARPRVKPTRTIAH